MDVRHGNVPVHLTSLCDEETRQGYSETKLDVKARATAEQRGGGALADTVRVLLGSGMIRACELEYRLPM